MQTLALTLLTVLTLTATAFVHLRIAEVAGRSVGLWVTRGVLVLAGIGFGWAALRYAAIAAEPLGMLDRLLVFGSAFGMVHVPGMFILLLKLWRRQG
ncbi:MAG: hypothetical protein JJT88_00705 [Gammaproteobacteria bacterium]|nr:hypothetical protein [Gammaproteobacteria bacterium]